MSKIGKKQLNISPEIFNLIKIKKIVYSSSFSKNSPLIRDSKGKFSQKTTNNYFIKLIISGPLGTQSIFIPDLFNIEILSDSLKIYPSITSFSKGLLDTDKEDNLKENLDSKTKRKRNQLWGTLWTQVNKMIQGVTIGFKRYIKLTGIGYKANLIELSNSKILTFNIGFSHPVNIEVPLNINIKNISNTSQGSIIEVSSNSLTDLNNFLFNIKNLRPADKSFKGSGISIINPEISITT